MQNNSSGTTGFSRSGLKRIDQLMEDYVAQRKSAGMLTLVSRRGRIEHLSMRGYAEIETATEIREDTIFRIYSMTKPVTSVALMTLMEQGYFKLDDPAKNWIPALGDLVVYPGDKLESDITIRHLLTHTAGFSYGFEPETSVVDQRYAEIWRQPFQHQSLEQLMPGLFEIPLVAQPGTRWHYSIATDICGYLVEIISGKPFAEYLQQTILDPLQMVDTAFAVSADRVDRFACLYGHTETDPLARLEQQDQSPFIPAFSGVPVNLHSGGAGLTSTAGDYWRFAQMMLNGGELDGQRILDAATVSLMTQNHVAEALLPLEFNGIAPGAFPGYGFGLGYCINLDPENTAAMGSRGDYGWGGLADTYCWIDPQQDLVAILMQQYMPSLLHPGRKDFRNAVYAALA